MIPHKPRKYLAAKPHHIAVKTAVKGVNFNHPRLQKTIIHLLNLLSQRPGIALSAYSILSNHIHIIVQFDKQTDEGKLGRDMLFGDAMRMFNSQLSRAVNRFYKRKGPLFHDRYWMAALKTGTYILNGFRYVLFNALKHINMSGNYQLDKDPRSSLYAYKHKLVNLKLIQSTRYTLLRGSHDYFERDYFDIVKDLVFI